MYNVHLSDQNAYNDTYAIFLFFHWIGAFMQSGQYQYLDFGGLFILRQEWWNSL